MLLKVGVDKGKYINTKQENSTKDD